MPITIHQDLRKKFGPARDQGLRGTCTAFAASDTHAAVRGPFAPLSCEYAHYHAIRRKGSSDPESGVSLPVMMQTLEHDGQPEETGWPYLSKLPADLAHWVPPSNRGPVFKRGSAPSRAAVSQIIAHLDAGVPVILTMEISLAFRWPDADMVIDGTPSDRAIGVHALIAVGHGERSKERTILIRNSWGSRWADSGHGWLTEQYLEPRLCDVATMI